MLPPVFFAPSFRHLTISPTYPDFRKSDSRDHTQWYAVKRLRLTKRFLSLIISHIFFTTWWRGSCTQSSSAIDYNARHHI